MRLIKIKAVSNDRIILTVILDQQPSEQVAEDMSVAATEIVSDFLPPYKISERFLVDTEVIPAEGIFVEGWVYRRFEEGQ